LYHDVAQVTVTEFHQSSLRLLIPLLLHKPPDPADFIVSTEACLSHDGTAVLPGIRAQTLLIGGTEDTFFSPALLREAAALLPHASLMLIEGSGHGAYELRRKQFEDAVIRFVDGRN
jgi:pimeloyl-ACP methyl ester carboxylesterase